MAQAYYTPSFISIALPDGFSAVSMRDESVQGVVLGSDELAVARACQTLRTLADHGQEAVAAVASFGRDQNWVKACVAKLKDLNVLVPEAQLHAELRAAEVRDSPARITSLCVPTKDRPESLRLCLESYQKTLGRRQDVRFVVADQSPPDGAAKNRDICAQIAATTGITVLHADLAFAATVVERLAATGLDRRILEFALLNPLGSTITTGGARNLLALLTAGEGVVSADDDTFGLFVRGAQSGDGLILGGRESGDLRVFHDAAALAAATTAEPLDIWREHEKSLGRPAAAVAREALGRGQLLIADTQQNFWDPVVDGSSQVLLTAAGLAGDSGVGSPIHYMLVDGPTRAQLWSEAASRRLLVSRQILRVPPRAQLLPLANMMMPHVGIDQRTVLAPFMPVMRNQDGIWARLLAKVRPRTHAMQLPFAVRHEPAAARSFPPVAEHKPPAPTSEMLVVELLNSINVQPSRAVGLGDVARELAYIAGLSDKALREWAYVTSCRNTANLNAIVVKHISDGRCEAFELATKSAYLREVARALEDFRFTAPADLIAQPRMGDPLTAFRAMLRSYGELAAAWPEIVAAARATLPR